MKFNDFKLGDIVLYQGKEVSVIGFNAYTPDLLLDVSSLKNTGMGWDFFWGVTVYNSPERCTLVDISSYKSCLYVPYNEVKLVNQKKLEVKNKLKEDLTMEKLILKELVKKEKKNEQVFIK